MREFAQRPQNHYPRNVEASTTSPKNRTSAPWLPASWNERSRPKPRRFKHLRRFLIFWFFEIHREIASVSNGSLRFEKQVGDEPASKSAPSEIVFWRYPCNGFGDARQSSQTAWVPKASASASASACASAFAFAFEAEEEEEARGWKLEAGGWRLKAGGWRLEARGRKPEKYSGSIFLRPKILREYFFASSALGCEPIHSKKYSGSIFFPRLP